MKRSGFGFAGNAKKGYHPDNDWEVAEELSPDPFSEEDHSRIHARRFSQSKNSQNMKNSKKKRNSKV
ncbi:MAG: hypothetical protein GX136_02775 [Clostridiales bacterium]|jgi:hypothetical protein|nr:hypothetical protein [Clostridiales bacterium]